MVDERRYTDEEVEEIFRAAVSPATRGRDLPLLDGLVLTEIQAIGREVGISPERIATEAARLDARPVQPTRTTVLGMPVSVGRTVDLPRAPTDREWSILVGELREIFRAHGRESTSPDTRSWNNGNLHVVIEPTEAGSRLRMATRKSDARATTGMGLFFVAMAVMLFFSIDGGSNEIVASILFALMAAATISYNAVRLPAWASEREEQMGYVAGRMLELLARPAAEVPPSREP